MTEVLPVTVAETARLGERILAEVEQVIVGKPEAVRLVLDRRALAVQVQPPPPDAVLEALVRRLETL